MHVPPVGRRQMHEAADAVVDGRPPRAVVGRTRAAGMAAAAAGGVPAAVALAAAADAETAEPALIAATRAKASQVRHQRLILVEQIFQLGTLKLSQLVVCTVLDASGWRQTIFGCLSSHGQMLRINSTAAMEHWK